MTGRTGVSQFEIAQRVVLYTELGRGIVRFMGC